MVNLISKNNVKYIFTGSNGNSNLGKLNLEKIYNKGVVIYQVKYE